jgi:hypothetical protein
MDNVQNCDGSITIPLSQTYRLYQILIHLNPSHTVLSSRLKETLDAKCSRLRSQLYPEFHVINMMFCLVIIVLCLINSYPHTLFTFLQSGASITIHVLQQYRRHL